MQSMRLGDRFILGTLIYQKLFSNVSKLVFNLAAPAQY